jgi:hypothetical protein
MTGRWGFADTVMPAGPAIAEIGLSSIIPIAIRVLRAARYGCVPVVEFPQGSLCCLTGPS